jgi:hypothetical protein
MAMSTTITRSVDCETTLSRLGAHLSGAAEQLSKFQAMRTEEQRRGKQPRNPDRVPGRDGVSAWGRTQEEEETLTRDSIERRRAKNALMGELKEALELATRLPGDPLY